MAAPKAGRFQRNPHAPQRSALQAKEKPGRGYHYGRAGGGPFSELLEKKMKYQAFLIKYAEIGVKGKNRYIFEDALVKRIGQVLAPVEGDFIVTKENGRIYAIAGEEMDFDEAVDALQHVFGIAWICPVVQLQDEGFDVLKQKVVDYMRSCYPDGGFSFKMQCSRARKNYPVCSQDMNALIGEAVLEAIPTSHVDVHKPEILVCVEIRDHNINLYSSRIPGAGGMPAGTGGRGMLLLSGGIDSPVAGYMVAKRGVTIEAVYFHAPPYTSDRAKQKVVDLASQVAKYAGPIRLHVINFTDSQLYIYEKCPHEELTIIMRRYMMRIAETLAKESGCLGLITGESIGQVASQTMQSLVCTNAVCTLPVFRPVIAFDKQEIVDVSLKIGTYETSILPFEDCCTIFVAKHPVTRPLLHVIERSEKKLEEKIDELVKTALDTDEVIECR